MWLFLAVAPVALAEPAGDKAGGTGPAQAESPAPGPSADPVLEQKSMLTGPQMLDQAKEYRKEIEGIRGHIQNQVEAAKADKDVIRLNCLLDKLTQLGANSKIMDQSLQALQEVVIRRDEAAQLHEYTRITIIHQKAEVLRTEADACVGAETNYVGPTKVVTESPSGMPTGTEEPIPPFTGLNPPPPVSPFL